MPKSSRHSRRLPFLILAFLALLDSPGRVVLELKPDYELNFDSKKMWARKPDAAPPGRFDH